jgi:endonuclease III
MNKKKVAAIFARLKSLNPQPTTELEYSTPFELLVAVILSAQATDKGVNLATRTLFKHANTPQAIAKLGVEGLSSYIRTIGLFNSKAKNVVEMCRILLEQHGGEVPQSREALEALPGVGRKTANVILGNAFGGQAIAVDTHVFRVSQRLGLARSDDPEKIHDQLADVLPEKEWTFTTHLVQAHGRRCCFARKPLCPACPVRTLCPWPGKTKIR